MDLHVLENLVKGVLPHDWKGVHTSGSTKTPLKSVEVMDCGLNLAKQQVWVKTRFTGADGVAHTLMGKMAVTEAGKQGGADTITLDDVIEPHDDCVIGIQFSLFPPGAKLVVAYKFGNGERYEFGGGVPIGAAFGL